MPSILSTITALASLLIIVNATPLSLHKRKAFSLQQVERTKFLKNGPEAKARAYAKYGVEAPSSLMEAAMARTEQVKYYSGPVNGSAPAVPIDEYDSLYLTPTTCGDSTVQLDFDTGSADLWVFSSLQASAQLVGHEYYNVSTGTILPNSTWQIRYGDGSSAAGKVYADKVVVGGITATSQAVEAATSVSSAFQRDQHTDGLLGLSFSILSTVRPIKQKTWFDNIKDDLVEPLFAVTLKYHAPGTYDFGSIDPSKYVGEITYVDVDTSNGWWEFNVTSYSVGSGYRTPINFNVIGDTGTTLMYLPGSINEAYYKQIPGAEDNYDEGGWTFPCNSTMPDFTLEIGGKDHVMPGKHLIYAPLGIGSPMCYGGIQDGDAFGFSILGDTFFKSKYVVHEFKDIPRIGIAQQAGL